MFVDCHASCFSLCIPLLCISVPFNARGQATNPVVSGSSSLHTTLMHISSVEGPWPSSEPCRKWFFKSSYHSRAHQFRSKQRTMSQVVYQLFIPLSRASVPFKARGQAANRVASGSSSLHTTFVRISSV